MAQRVRLTWNRNQDNETSFYRVYRSESPNINAKNRLEHYVMKVAHPDRLNPIKVENEKLKRYSGKTYLLEHKNILIDELGVMTFPFILLVNGKLSTMFTLDKAEGAVIFDDPLEIEDEVVVQEYTFDGMQVWDYGVEELAKDYYGPEAKDLSAPLPPTNVRMEMDYEKNRVVIKWNQTDPVGKKFYYRIDAAIDSANYSGLSEWRTATLREPLADRPYLVERSSDGKEWKQIARIQQNVFYEYMIDRTAPEPLQGVSANLYMYKGKSEAQVTLSWIKPLNNLLNDTALYRVRAANKLGAVSEPSPIVGPIPFQVGLKEIIIRRKLNDGTLPTYDGPDSITVGRVTDMNVLSFTEDVEDNNEYIYGLWVVDRAGNYSALSYVTINVWDGTAPLAPMNLSVDQFQIVAG